MCSFGAEALDSVSVRSVLSDLLSTAGVVPGGGEGSGADLAICLKEGMISYSLL